MPGPSISAGRDGLFAVAAETAFGDGGNGYAAADDFIDCSGWSVTVDNPGTARDDAHGLIEPLGDIAAKQTVELSLSPTYLKPNTNGTNPDVHTLLTYGGWQTGGWSGTDAVEAGSTTTTINLTGHGYSAGEAVRINGEVRMIASTNTNDITLNPPLSTTPSATDPVSPCLVYKIKTSRDTTPDSLAGWVFDNRRAYRIRGAFPTSYAFTGSQDEGLKFQAQFGARRADAVHSTSLDGSINDTTTTVTLAEGHGVPSDVSASDPLYLQVGSEVLKVIGISGNDATTDTRGVYLGGGAAASHSDGAEVYAYHYDPSTAGNIVDSTAGDVWINGVEVLSCTAASLSVEMGVEPWAPEHGDAYAVPGYSVARGGVVPTITIEALARAGHALALEQRHRNRSATEVFWQQGSTAGAIFAVHADACYLQAVPSSADAGEAAASLSLVFDARAPSTSAASVFLIFS